MRNATRTLMAIALVAATIPAAARSLEKTFDEKYMVSSGTVLELSNVNGSIHLEAWDGQEVWVRAELELEARNSEVARQAFEDLRVEVDQDSSSLRVKARHPRERRGGFFSWLRGDEINSSVRFDVRVPRELDIEVSTVNGRLVVEGTRGRLEASTVNGSVRIVNAGGELEAETVNGSVDVELTELGASDEVRISTVNGSVELDLPDDAAMNVKARTTNGRIRSDLPIAMNEMSRNKLAGQINGGGALLSVSTTNGSIKIR